MESERSAVDNIKAECLLNQVLSLTSATLATMCPFNHGSAAFRTDRVTSVLIPLGLSAVGAVVITKGLYHMYTGTGKLE